MYKYLYVCVYIYINLKNMSTAHLLITKPHAQGPIHELPHRKNASLFKRKKKMLLSHVLVLRHPYFCSLFN